MNRSLKRRSASFSDMNRQGARSPAIWSDHNMRRAITLAATIATVLGGAVVPVLAPSTAAAQSWQEDPCQAQRHAAGRNGALAGGILGAIFGSQAAGRGSRTTGTLLGAGAGAMVGHQVGKSSVQCSAYPHGYRQHAGCHWVTDYSGRQAQSYEVCRNRDGYWRPRS